MKHGILVKDDQGNMDVVVCNSRTRAEALREVIEEAGIETFGIVRIVSFVDVMLGGEHK